MRNLLNSVSLILPVSLRACKSFVLIFVNKNIRELRISSHMDGGRTSSCDNKRLPTKSTTAFRPNHLGPSLPANHDVSAE